MSKGWIYILASETHPLHKIGLTTTSPAQRVKEINASTNYGPFGPWVEIDVRRVRDVSAVESALHRRYDAKRSAKIPNAREAFEVTRAEARQILEHIPEVELTEAIPVHNLKVEPDFMDYLLEIFQNSGLNSFRELQESWTFSLYPSTGGGRFFTLNIDRHEVAYSTPVRGTDTHLHSVVVDELITRDQDFKNQLRALGGVLEKTAYTSNWGHAATVSFQSSFFEAQTILRNPTFRRALLAYWYDALLRMQTKGTRSLFARFHNYDAVSEIFRHMEERRQFRQPT